MARRRQTTGLPNKEKKAQAQETEPAGLIDNLLGNPTNRQEREDAINNLLQRVVMAVIAAVVVIVAGALTYEFLIVPNLTVASVNSERITVQEFRDRVALERSLVLQQANVRYSELQQQASAFNIEVDQLAQQDQQFQQWNRELQFPDLLGDRVLDDMIDVALVEQEFEARGLSLDEGEIETSRQSFFGYDATAVAMIGTPGTETPTPTITPTPFVSPTPTNTPSPTEPPTSTPVPTLDPEATAEVTAEVVDATPTILPTIPASPTPSQEERFENYEQSVDIFEESIREGDVGQSVIERYWEEIAILNAVEEAIVGQPETTLYVNARHILVETEDEANAIIEALNNGESFALLAQAQSTDTGSGARGGELGWNPVLQYVPPFADAATEAEIGAIVGPVESDFGFHIIQVRDREERDLTDTVRQQITQAEFGRWLTERREAAEAADEISINDNWPDFLTN